LLLIFILILVNGYVFFWRDESSLDSLGLETAAIGQGPIHGVAVAPENACGGDPVDVFAGLPTLLHMQSRLSEGRTLRLALLELGVDGAEIDALEASIRTTMDLGLLGGSGAPLRLAADREGKVQALELELADGHLIQTCREPAGFKVRNIQHPFRMDVAVVSMKLGSGSSLLDAVEEAGEQPALAAIVAETFAHHVDFMTESRPGDRVQLIVQKRYLGKHFHRYGSVLAVRYIGSGGRLAFYRYKPEGGEESFFDFDGIPMRRALRRSPISWYPISDEERGSLPPKIEFVDGQVGALYKRPKGAPVVALADGTISEVGMHVDEGLVVELSLADGRQVRYENLMRTIGELAVGQEVRQGQFLGLVGDTGKTPVTRLRLELVDAQGELADPMLLTARGSSASAFEGTAIPKQQLERFSKDIRPWRAAMRSADLR
jgi:murein DD-endopeptidase MepM/ murein hydrolase activator NlpD